MFNFLDTLNIKDSYVSCGLIECLYNIRVVAKIDGSIYLLI